MNVPLLLDLPPGYQRQLTYQKSSGCFSIWSHTSCNLWYADTCMIYTHIGIIFIILIRIQWF